MVDAIRQIGVSEVTYYRWRQEFGGLKSEQVKRLKAPAFRRASYADIYWVSCKGVYPEISPGYIWGTRRRLKCPLDGSEFGCRHQNENPPGGLRAGGLSSSEYAPGIVLQRAVDLGQLQTAPARRAAQGSLD